MNPDDFFDQGEDRPEIVAGRYRLPHPETGAEQSWTRATTHAELPEDSFALARWQLRQLLRGLNRRPDLLRLVESWNAEELRDDDMDPVIATAHEVAGNDARANLGTAVHGVLQRVDRGWVEHAAEDQIAAGQLDAFLAAVGVPEWALPHARSYVAELRRCGLRPIPSMTERRVINTDLDCAGTLDNLYEEADGTTALGDKKTGRIDRYTERKFAIQIAIYLGASHMLDPAGGPPVDLRALKLRREYAILIYVDPEAGACSVYRVDVRRGQLGANLASQVREWRRERHFLLPYVPPVSFPTASFTVSGGLADDATTAGLRDSVRDLDPSAVLAHLPRYDKGSPGNEPVGTFAVSGGLVDDPGNEHSANSTTATLGDALAMQQAFDAAARNGVWTMDDLMKLSKAELQTALRRLDPGATVAHQRKILAEKILTLQNGGTVATAAPATYRSKDPAEIAGPVGGEDPTDPRSPAFHRARLAEIAAAPSVADLGRIHAGVVRLGGDQAWTDAMTEAARARTAQLDSAQVRKIEFRGGEATPAEAVALAESSQEMAQVWNATTVGGSDEAAWTAELNELAHARLAALQAAVERPRPPATPFGEA